jgi:hypothetical protein
MNTYSPCIEKTESGIQIVDANQRDRVLNTFALKRLTEVIVIGDYPVSQIISDLSRKSWITNDLLYKLAKITADEFPDSEIDLVYSLFSFEKGQYLKSVAALTDEFRNQEEKISNDFLKMVEHGRKESNKNIDAEIRNIIIEKLKDYGIV